MTDRWWLRPLKSIALGLALGLGLTWVVGQLNEKAGTIVLMTAVFGLVVYCVWTLVDLRRMEREHRQVMADLERQLRG